MSQPIIFFRKNWADFERSNISVSATEGSSTASYILDRSNRSAWGTSGSVDSNNTQMIVNMGDVGTIDSILLLKHNFKSFLLEYLDPISSIWTTIASPTGVTTGSSFYKFQAIQTSQIRLTIYGTQVANTDKVLCQFIATSQIGQLQGWPIISKPTLARNLVEKKMLSGKSYVLQNVGYYAASLSVQNWSSPADLGVVEALFNNSEGFLYWPCGGDQTQFSSVRQGYRMEDIYLVRCKNEFSPEWAQGLYKAGMKMQLDLVEVIT